MRPALQLPQVTDSWEIPAPGTGQEAQLRRVVPPSTGNGAENMGKPKWPEFGRQSARAQRAQSQGAPETNRVTVKC